MTLPPIIDRILTTADEAAALHLPHPRLYLGPVKFKEFLDATEHGDTPASQPIMFHGMRVLLRPEPGMTLGE